jgi:hypothetical protein
MRARAGARATGRPRWDLRDRRTVCVHCWVDAGPVAGRPITTAAPMRSLTIAYPDGNRGQVLYIKTSITGVLAYRAAHPEFPHQTTADQWFDESQFESYRALGRFVIESLFDGVGTPDEVSAQSTKALFENLSEIMRTN